ncbi:MAG: EamA family transporter [Pseudobutyrivibrio sp.]|nr:EamA family transporter [Pseudobutyrivibrio sp.]
MGILLVVLASLLLGSYPSIQEYVMTTGASPLGMVIVCNSVAGLSAFIVGIIKKENFKVNIKELKALALTGILGLFMTDYLLNVAYTMIPVGFTTMIHFFYPALVTMIMVVLFRENFTWKKLGAIVISIIGLALISGGDFSGKKIGIVIALMTAFTYAFYMIANDKTSARNVPLMVRSFYLNVFVVLTAIITNMVTKKAVLPVGAVNIGLSAMVGVMLCLAIVMLNAGISRLGAGKASFINMLEPITSLVVSTIVFKYTISLMAILGALLIIGSLILVAKDGDQQEVIGKYQEALE